MSDETLIQNARFVNEGRITEGDLLIRKGRIEKIAPAIMAGLGLIGTPNPITDTGTIDVDFAGTPTKIWLQHFPSA